jgi:hypothetical protein
MTIYVSYNISKISPIEIEQQIVPSELNLLAPPQQGFSTEQQ